MRHKYDTRAIILARTPVGEANVLVTLLTSDLGLVRARAQGLRRPGAKLAHALATFVESDVVLVRGKEQWRLAGAMLAENWFQRLSSGPARERAGRITMLLLRLVAGEAQDPALFSAVQSLLSILATEPEETHDAAEVLAALAIVRALGLDAGELPGELPAFTPALAAAITRERMRYVARINSGIAASGL